MPEELLPMVLSGRGIAWLPEAAIREALDAGQLEASPVPGHVITAEIRIFRSARTLEAHIERVWDYLTQLSTIDNDGPSAGGTSTSAAARSEKAPREGKRPAYRLDGSVDVSQSAYQKPPQRRVRR